MHAGPHRIPAGAPRLDTTCLIWQVDSLLGLGAVSQWSALLQPTPLAYALPGVAIGYGIRLALMRFHHYLVLSRPTHGALSTPCTSHQVHC